MNRALWLSCALGLITVAGCRPQVDHASEIQNLLERDRAWARAAGTGSVDSIVAYWTDDAQVLLPGQPAYVGTEAIRQMVTASLAIPGFQISWAPESAVVAASGDLAYTYGTNRVTLPDSTGHATATEGRYVEVWRKGADGQWRCAIDINNAGPATPAPTS